MEGWIQLHRSLLEWEWYDEPNVKILFIHFLLMANHKPNNWRGETIEKGSYITSLSKISVETGLSIKQVRNCIKKLQSTGEIQIKGTKWTKVTICNYASYQQTENKKGKQGASKGQAKGKQRATTNNDNNDNNVNKIEEFYQNQLELSNENKYYKSFIDILFGRIGEKITLNGVLSIPDQLTYEQFGKLLEKAQSKNKRLSELVYNMENGGYFKGKQSLYLTLNKWINNE